MKKSELKQLIKETISEIGVGSDNYEQYYSPQYRFQLTIDFGGYEPHQLYFATSIDALEHMKTDPSIKYKLFEIKRELR